MKRIIFIGIAVFIAMFIILNQISELERNEKNGGGIVIEIGTSNSVTKSVWEIIQELQDAEKDKSDTGSSGTADESGSENTGHNGDESGT